MHNPEISWKVWKLLEAIDWRALPLEGGLLEQPEWLMEDLMTIGWLKRDLEEKTKPAPESVEAGQIRKLSVL